METKKFAHYLSKILSIILILIFTYSCGPFAFKRSDVKDNPINDRDKRTKNIKEGKGISIGSRKVDQVLSILQHPTRCGEEQLKY